MRRWKRYLKAKRCLSDYSHFDKNREEALAALGDNDINETFDGLTGSSQYQDFFNRL